ncbi:Protein of unknown function [Gryllus bimaculatus]|nr:Protein of unknown function [Gryllus bimaculatus]
MHAGPRAHLNLSQSHTSGIYIAKQQSAHVGAEGCFSCSAKPHEAPSTLLRLCHSSPFCTVDHTGLLTIPPSLTPSATRALHPTKNGRPPLDYHIWRVSFTMYQLAVFAIDASAVKALV